MKITFLGTSHGVPEPNRKCSSTLIETGGNHYLIDMGTQAIEQLITMGIDLNTVKAVFITHMHGDHTNGLISFIDLCNWYFKTADPYVYLPGDPETAKAALAGWLQCNGNTLRPFQFLPVKEGLIFDDGTLRITAFQTKHTACSFAFLAEAKGKRVLFSGDLCHKGPQEDFPVSVLDAPLDLAVCECAHFNADKYLPVFEGKTGLKRLCFTHYQDKNIASILNLKAMMPDVEILRGQDGTQILL